MVHTIADPLRQDCPWQSNVLASMMGCGCGAAFTHVTRLPCSFHMCDAAAVRLPCVRCRSPIGPVWPSARQGTLHGRVAMPCRSRALTAGMAAATFSAAAAAAASGRTPYGPVDEYEHAGVRGMKQQVYEAAARGA
eukprot:355846-Chlamydomonas_euryale.AAC.8